MDTEANLVNLNVNVENNVNRDNGVNNVNNVNTIQNEETNATDWTWDSKPGKEVEVNITWIYDEVVHWRRNIFMPPSGNATKQYIKECTRLIMEWVNNTQCSSIALKALFLMPHLLMQKPFSRSKCRDHLKALERRLKEWKEGNFIVLYDEARAIQQRLKPIQKTKREINEISQEFGSLMQRGKVNAAIKLIDKNMKGDLLPLNAQTLQLLKQKHPEAKSASPTCVLEGPVEKTNPVIFEEIDGILIRKMAISVQGSAGPSGHDADAWKKLLVNRTMGTSSTDLCTAIAEMTKKLCTISIAEMDQNNSSIEALIACRLIPIDKVPGLRPIGIGEVLRRIIGKAVMSIVKSDVMQCAGSMQLCAGQKAGGEAAIHAMRKMFACPNTEGVLLVDASNAFNSLNRQAMRHNVNILCPPLSQFVHNIYGVPARLYIFGGGEIRSAEGTTQGDPISMAIYAIGINPMLSCLMSSYNRFKIRQVAFADDLSGAGSLQELKNWWKYLCEIGPSFGYFPNPNKSWLIVKSNFTNEAHAIFTDTEIQVTNEGNRHLGAVIGSNEYKTLYVTRKVNDWIAQLNLLSEIGRIDPHSAYTAFVFGLKHKWTYLMRTIPDMSTFLEPLEIAIKTKFIPAIFGTDVSTEMRDMLALPPKMGGLGIINPVKTSGEEFENSKLLTKNLTQLIEEQKHLITLDASEQKRITTLITKTREENQNNELDRLRRGMSERDERINDMARESGSSNWLTALPLKEYGFSLNKQEFKDSLALRYGTNIKGLPDFCACGLPFSIDHSMTCKRGGFVTHRHNELRDLTAQFLREVCIDVEIEPQLLELSGEAFHYRTANTRDDARLDISARGFWIRGQRAFYDTRVFYPLARSYQSQNLTSLHQRHENEKRRAYNQRVLQVEMGSFTPLVFTTAGGMAKEASLFYSKLAGMISEKRNQHKSVTTAWLRCRLGFSLLRSALLCLRGSRTVRQRCSFEEVDFDLAAAQARLRID